MKRTTVVGIKIETVSIYSRFIYGVFRTVQTAIGVADNYSKAMVRFRLQSKDRLSSDEFRLLGLASFHMSEIARAATELKTVCIAAHKFFATHYSDLESMT